MGSVGRKEASEGSRIDRVMSADDAKTHWEKVYATKAPEQVSWYRPHLEVYPR